MRQVRRQVGGNFYNNWHGRNRYTPADGKDQTPLARGLYLIHGYTIERLKSVRFAPPQPVTGMQKPAGTKLEILAQADPTRVLYNALVPFSVAALEHFFGQAFRIFLRYDINGRWRLLDQTRKIEFLDAMALVENTKSIEDIVADWYSFQNIESIHKAFNEWFGIDIWKLFRQRRRVGKRIGWLEQRLKALIDFRHGIVHRFEVNVELDRPGLEKLLDLCILLIETFVDHVEISLEEKIRE